MRRKRPTRTPEAHNNGPGGVSVNETFSGTVRDVSAAGSGVVEHPGGRIFFVPGVWIGERGSFRVTALRGRFGHAVLEALTAASPQRVAPACPHHGTGPTACGGCPWQFIDYTAQCAAKDARVRAAMEQLGAGATVQALWPSPQSYGYRNRAQLKTDGSRLGYVAAGSNTLVPINDCPVLTPSNRDTLAALLARLPDPALKPARGQPWSSLDIDDDISADGVVPDQRRPFRQGNSAQNARMQEWLAHALDPLPRSAPVLELFAGDGNFTAAIAEMGFTDILALDSAQDAIATLSTRQLPGVISEVCNLYAADAFDRLRKPLAAAQILVLDPPRDGLKHVDVLLHRARSLQHVLYVSCDLATFTRDLARFVESGFKVAEVQPLDQFPHTPHIELLGRLTR